MTPLIDGDILCHEIGWANQWKDKDTGEEVLLDWDYVERLLDERIRIICYEVEATEKPIIFLSESQELCESINRERRLYEDTPRVYTRNFRYGRATTKPYKGTRTTPKPFHFKNILTYLRTQYSYIISSGGIEADDEIGIYQSTSKEPTVICSRDKDLRMIEGWHYSWECGKQPALGPTKTDDLGWLELNQKGKVLGYGQKFFYFQMLTGDSIDNIPGLPSVGEKKAYAELNDLKSIAECREAVIKMYKQKMGAKAKDYYQEQKDLLWIKRNRE